VDNLGFGVDKREVLEEQLSNGDITSGNRFRQCWTVQAPFDECIHALSENIEVDPHFFNFYQWTKEHNDPIVVLSSGMAPAIHALLEKPLGQQARKHLSDRQ
jgi:2-hydroxy-3-keto-5-methylthiopentenyl-1-phosphate phosphatase